jgi:peptidoglycan/LPS O-acetylase OafA/YrhL
MVKTGFLNRVETVRGLAALCVVLGHTAGLTLPNRGAGLPLFDQPYWREFAMKLVNGFTYGETAVIVFFVISGVVIGRSLDKKKVTSPASYVGFLARRFFRLYPAEIVSVCGILLLGLVVFVGCRPLDFSPYAYSSPALEASVADLLNGKIFNPIRMKSVVGNLTMASWTMNWVVWSLYVEVCAAPFLPLFHNLARRKSGWIDVAVMSALIAVFYLAWDNLWSRYLFVFYAGMLVETHGTRWAALLERSFGGIRPALLASYLVMVIPTTLAGKRTPEVILLEAIGAFSVMCMIVRSEGRAPLSVLENPVLRWNGRLSYSLYLWHFAILTITARFLYETLSPEVMWSYDGVIFGLTLVATLAVALGIAQLSYKFVEIPMIAVGQKLVKLGSERLAGIAAGPTRRVLLPRQRS